MLEVRQPGLYSTNARRDNAQRPRWFPICQSITILFMRIKLLQPSRNFTFANDRRSYLLCCIVLAVSIYSEGIYSAGNETIESNAGVSENSVSVEFRNGRLSVSAKQIPIVELMRLVGNETGFEVTAYGDFTGQSVSLSFSGLQLGDAVRRLLRNTSAVVSYGSTGDPAGKSAINKIFLLGASPARVSAIQINTLEPGLETSMRINEIQSGDSGSRIASIDRAEGLSDEITLENLAFSLQHDPDPEVRLKAVSALEKIGGSTAVEVLESGLGDDDRQVRKKVVQTLGGIDDERIPLWLGQVLMGDPSAEVRLVAVRSIARKEGDTARIFLEAATGDSSRIVSEAAIGLLR